MNSIKSLSSLAICFCIFMSACPLGSTAFASTSLWGKKLVFQVQPCLWQLHSGVPVPALRELSVCMSLRRTISADWTGFEYKAPGNRETELGLGGKNGKLFVKLFGHEWQYENNLTVNGWHSVCLTWSGQAQRLRISINSTFLIEICLTTSQQLSKNGTLTLGVSHYVNANGEIQPETGTNLVGEIALFRMWAREWSLEELKNLNCTDGDLVSWDLKQWTYSCPPEPSINLHCAWSFYTVKMETCIFNTLNPGNLLLSLEEISKIWLESIFHKNTSIHSILVSSPCSSCPIVNDSATLDKDQELELLSNTICDSCFSCEVHIHVNPPADVEVVQTEITALLSLRSPLNFLNLSVQGNDIVVLPVEQFSNSTEPAPTVSSETTPTLSPSVHPTTREPLHVNDTAEPDQFFRVDLVLNMTGNPLDPKDIIEKWVKKQLEVNNTMSVLNLDIKENAVRNMEHYFNLMISQDQPKQYYCAFHVQECNKNTVAEIEILIQAALVSKYQNHSIIIQTVEVMIRHIVPKNCSEDTSFTIYGKYIWPETFPQRIQVMGCITPTSERAFRLCKLDIETDTTRWADPNMKNCHQHLSISDLNNITVTPGNAAEVVVVIQDLVVIQLGNSSELSPSHLESVVEKLSEVVDESIVNSAVGANIVTIVSDILLSNTDVTPVSNTFLNLTDRMADNMIFQGESANLTAPPLGFSMINVDPEEFSGLTFGASIVSPTKSPEMFVDQGFVNKPHPTANATISLPSALNDFFPTGGRNTTRVQFQFYGTHELFQDLDINNAQSNWTLNSYVVSASINDSKIMNLEDRVVVTFSHQVPTKPRDKVQCMFWDFYKNGGRGGWNSSGCETESISPYQTSCLCDHLTHFAVLLNVERTPFSKVNEQILTVVSYIGCGISSIFLGLTLLTYLIFEKLRQDYPSKILINLSSALQGLSMLFLLNTWLSSFSNYALCIATAATLHYFMLASFTWMGLEAVHMYLALVKVFNTYIPSYILKFCIIGWGIPAVIVSLVLVIDKDAYGSLADEEIEMVLDSTEAFCWIQNDIVFFVTVVAFIGLTLLCNMSVFIMVLIQIKRIGANKLAANSQGSVLDLKAVASLTVLLGLTWSIGFFSFGPARVVLVYLFVFLNSLQGFFVFLFHCLMKENVRKQWRIHLCCGRFRLREYSDWSRSVTVGDRCKKKNLVNSDSVTSGSSQ
nr:adhesion G-protein coupled receptor G4 isoform X1 [Maylandia zebra]XP_023010521.2 adhesion G-protein coupled receptor G4 isoform X1 [Maylandia zebra]